MASLDYSEISLQILGIMTPLDVSRIAKVSTGVRKVTLIEVMLKGERVLAKDYKEEEKEDENVVSLEEERALREKQEEEQLEELAATGTDGNTSTSMFLINERQKLKKSVSNIERPHILRSYKQNSAVDVEMLKREENKYKRSSEKGVLVNKKQS